MISATTATPGISSTGTTAAATANAAGSEDRFLKLLVAQLSNQDPMNPMDNAQMTSQMAQISTVSSVQQVNTTLQGLAGQLASMQMMQGGSLVGHQVLVEGNKLAPEGGKAGGAIGLDLKADSVTVEILSGSGKVIDSINLGAKAPGRHDFEWDASRFPGVTAPTYRVTAMAGGNAVAATTLVRDKIVSVGAENGAMHLQLKGQGPVAYDSVKAIL